MRRPPPSIRRLPPPPPPPAQANLAPTVTPDELPFLWMRVVSAPAPGSTVDGSQTTAPHAASTLLRGAEVVLGITSVRHHLLKVRGPSPPSPLLARAPPRRLPAAVAASQAIESLRKAGGQAIPCFANIAFEGETEPTPRPFFYVPDATCSPTAHGSTSGFLMSEDRWEERLPRLVSPPAGSPPVAAASPPPLPCPLPQTCNISKLLLGAELAAALGEGGWRAFCCTASAQTAPAASPRAGLRPDLSLDEYK